MILMGKKKDQENQMEGLWKKYCEVLWLDKLDY